MSASSAYLRMLRYCIKKAKSQLHSSDPDFYSLSYSGWVGIGKTTAVLEYCKTHSGCFYFSFENMDEKLAVKMFAKKYPKVFTDCNNWEDFATQLFRWCENRNCVIFVDSFDYKKHNCFYEEIHKAFGNMKHRTVVMYIEDQIYRYQFTPLHFGEIKKLFPNITDEEVVMIKAVTGGIASLVDLYNPEISFEENLKEFLKPNSYFCMLAPRIVKEYFRTPESYNTLLYGIATGKKRISELAELSGYANNKCDKYIKSLMSAGIVKRIEFKSNKGTTQARYDMANEYFCFWYRYIFTHANYENDEVFDAIMKYVKNILVKRVFRKECEYWLEKNYYAYWYTNAEFYFHDERCLRNVKLNGTTFDAVFQNYGDYIFVKYFDTIGEHCTKPDWDEIEEATTKFNRLENNTYILFSIHRFSEYCWKISSKYDNLRLVQMTSFLPTYEKIYLLPCRISDDM